MENVVQRFYSSGKDFDNSRYTQFGAFAPNITKPPPAMAWPNRSSSAVYGTNNRMIDEDSKSVMFVSAHDLVKPFPLYGRQYQPQQQFQQQQQPAVNASKMHIMEEKMKNLELKAQRLEVINDFFFDMFENNIVKDQINQQRYQYMQPPQPQPYPQQQREQIVENASTTKVRATPKPQVQKVKKSKREANKPKQPKRPNIDFDPHSFQAKALKNASKVLKNIKRNVGEYILEEQLKKNEEMQNVLEQITDIKNEVNKRLMRLQKEQEIQLEGLCYVLQNSGIPSVEGMAKRVLPNPYGYPYNDVGVYPSERKVHPKINEFLDENEIRKYEKIPKYYSSSDYKGSSDYASNYDQNERNGEEAREDEEENNVDNESNECDK